MAPSRRRFPATPPVAFFIGQKRAEGSALRSSPADVAGVIGVRRAAFQAAVMPAARRVGQIGRFSVEPSLYFPAATLPAAPLK